MEWNWILEEYDDMVYVSDLNNYELLYVNRVGLDMFHLSREELFSGKKHLCYEIFHGRNTPCPFCTNKYLIQDFMSGSIITNSWGKRIS